MTKLTVLADSRSSSISMVTMTMLILLPPLLGAQTHSVASQLVNPCSVHSWPEQELGSLVVDCRGRKLRTLHSAWFPNNTSTLLLDRNSIQVLRNGTFQHLGNLGMLSAYRSGINRLESGSLQGLMNLRSLDLRHNNLQSSPLPTELFIPVPRLRYLRLEGNPCTAWTNTSNHSSHLFDPLTEVVTLGIESCTQLHLGHEFNKLRALKRLLIGTAVMTTVCNNSFEGLRAVEVEELYLGESSGKIKDFQEGVFQPLGSLKVLRLNGVNVGNKRALSALWPFQNKTLDVLEFESIYLHLLSLPGKMLEDSRITVEDFRFVQNICIRDFRWVSSRLLSADEEILSPRTLFTRCLKRATLGGNFIMVFDPPRVILFHSLKLSQLKEVTFGGISFDWKYVKAYLAESSRSNVMSVATVFQEQRVERSINSSSAQLISPTSLQTQSDQGSLSNHGLWVKWPSALRSFRLFTVTANMDVESEVFVVNGEVMKEIYFVNSGVARFYYRVLNLDEVVFLDCSGSMVEWTDNNFLDSFPNLRTLILNRFQNSDKLKQWGSTRFTQHLSNLEWLEASSCMLDHFPSDIFLTNTKLTTVFLKGNRFTSLPFDIDTTPNLVHLDIGFNAIVALTLDEMRQIDIRVQDRGTFRLGLAGNRLACNCQQLPFLGWLKKTQVSLDDIRDNPCTSEDGQLSTVGSLELRALWRQCVGQLALWMSLVIALTMITGFLVAYMWGKLRTSLIAFVLNALVPSFRLKTRRDYVYDVFFGYADDDFRFVRRTLLPFVEEEIGLRRTYVHQRDLRGGYMDRQLLEALQSSWRIVLLVTDSFLNSGNMGNVLTRMSVWSVSAENPGRVLVVVHEDLRYLVPEPVLSIMEEDRILVVQNWDLPLTQGQRLLLRQGLLGGR